jgi:hypothetical protein
MNRATVLPYSFTPEHQMNQYKPPHSIYFAPVWESPGVRKGEINNPADSEEVKEKTKNTVCKDYQLRKPLVISENYENLIDAFRKK